MILKKQSQEDINTNCPFYNQNSNKYLCHPLKEPHEEKTNIFLYKYYSLSWNWRAYDVYTDKNQ